MYNPVPRNGVKEVRVNVERARYWVSVGAQPSDRVRWLFGKLGVLPPAPVRVSDPTTFKIPRKIVKEQKKAAADKRAERAKVTKQKIEEKKKAKNLKKKERVKKSRLIRAKKLERALARSAASNATGADVSLKNTGV
jgi:ribosomal protein S16